MTSFLPLITYLLFGLAVNTQIFAYYAKTAPLATLRTYSSRLVPRQSTSAVITYSLFDQFTAPENPALSSVFEIYRPPDSHTIGLRVPPSWSFSIGIRGDTFLTLDGQPVNYVVRQPNGEALPNWIRFNPITFTFDGLSPSDSGAQMEIEVTVEDESVHDSFFLVVSEDESVTIYSSLLPKPTTSPSASSTTLSFSPSPSSTPLTWDVVIGEKFSIELERLLGSNSRNVQGQGLPTWAKLSPLSLTGVIPNIYNDSSVLEPITITYLKEDRPLTTTLTLQLQPNFFDKALPSPTFPIKPGDPVEFELLTMLASEQNQERVLNQEVALEVDFEPKVDWMHFDGDSLSIVGVVPFALDVPVTLLPEDSLGGARLELQEFEAFPKLASTPGIVVITFTATELTTQLVSHLVLEMEITSPREIDTEIEQHPSSQEGSQRKLALIITLSILFFLLILAFAFCMWRKGLFMGYCTPGSDRSSHSPCILHQDVGSSEMLFKDMENGVPFSIVQTNESHSEKRSSVSCPASSSISAPVSTKPSNGGFTTSSESCYPSEQERTSSIRVVEKSSLERTKSSTNMMNSIRGNPYDLSSDLLAPPKIPIILGRGSIDSTTSSVSSSSKYPTTDTSSIANGSSSKKNEKSPQSPASPKSLLDKILAVVPAFSSPEPPPRPVISKPRPLVPSVGARLVKEYEQQQLERMKNDPRTNIGLSTSAAASSTKAGSVNAVTSKKTPPAELKVLEKPAPVTHATSIPFPLHRPLPSAIEVSLSKENGTQRYSSSSSNLSGSSLESNRGYLAEASAGEKEVPHRRGDFVKRSPVSHTRVSSDESIKVVQKAIISTAALAVRTPTVGLKVFRSPASSVDGHPTIETLKLVQFDKERRSTMSEGDRLLSTDTDGSGPKRGISQKAIIRHCDDVDPRSSIPKKQVSSSHSTSALAQKVQELKTQRQVMHSASAAAIPPPTLPKVPPASVQLQSATSDYKDLKLVHGVHYMSQIKLGSDGNISNGSGSRASIMFFTSPPSVPTWTGTTTTIRNPRLMGESSINAGADARGWSEVGTGISLSGSEGSVTVGKAKVTAHLPVHGVKTRNTPNVEELGISPPHVPLPPPPKSTSTFDFDQALRQMSKGSGVGIVGGQERPMAEASSSSGEMLSDSSFPRRRLHSPFSPRL